MAKTKEAPAPEPVKDAPAPVNVPDTASGRKE